MKWTPDLRIVSATPSDHFTILIDWSDGTRRLFDALPHLHGDLFGQLGDPAYFAQMRIASHGETVEWPNGQDFSPEALFEDSTLVESARDDSRSDRPDLGTMPSIVEMDAKEDGMLVIDWSDGTRRLFDAWAYAGASIDALADKRYVTKAQVSEACDRVFWPNGESFEAAELFAKSVVARSDALSF